MHRRYLSGAALAALAIGASAGAAAQAPRSTAEQPIRLEVGGYFMFYLVGAEQDRKTGKPGNATRSHGFARESEIYFLGSTQLDNGLVVGVRVELEGETAADQIDETFAFMEHWRYGRIEGGQTKSVANKMWLGAPNVLPGLGINDPNLATVGGGTNSVVPSTFVGFGVSGDEEKVNLFTPRLLGFQFGLSYTPDGCEITSFAAAGAGTAFPCQNNGGLQPQQDLAQQSEIVEMAVNFYNVVGDWAYGLYAAGGMAHLERNATLGRFQNQYQWGIGGQLAYLGWTVGAGYRWNNTGFRFGPDFRFDGLLAAPTTQEDFNIGIAYQTGPWNLGAQYHRAWAKLTDINNDRLGRDKLEGVSLGATYLLGPGMTLAGGLEYRSFRGVDRSPLTPRNDAENDAVTFLLGTKIDF